MTAAQPALTARIREASPLAQLVAQYVVLKPAGADRLAGLCPFHQEKTPSFNVRPAAGLYYCHGCGAGGDVFTFLQKIEGIPFPEARRRLAEAHGISLVEKVLSAKGAALERQQRHYAEQRAADAAIWWRWVRDRYEFRRDLLTALAFRASGANDEPEYQRLARRAWRLGVRIRRLDALPSGELLRRYATVRERREVVTLIGRERDWQRAETEVWGRIFAAVRPEHLKRALEIMGRASCCSEGRSDPVAHLRT